MECIEGNFSVIDSGQEESWTDEEDEQEGRILDGLIAVAYGTMAGLALVIVLVMHLLGA